MQPLPKGVTGFDAPADGVSFARVKAAAYAAARQVEAQVHKTREAGGRGMLNFHEILMSLPYRPAVFRVLCNAHCPIVAFAAPAAEEGDWSHEFIDCPELGAALRSNFTILTSQEANHGSIGEFVALLSKAEMDQLRYWKPKRLGDIVFNHWD